MKKFFRNMFPKGASSLAVIIPSDICKKLEIGDKDRMEVYESRGVIKIRKAVK